MSFCEERSLKKLYHEIIKYESKLLSGYEESAEIPCYISAERFDYKDYCVLRRTDYVLEIENLKSIAKAIGLSEACVDELIRRGFLILVSKDGRYYRSFHMDTLIRASDVRIKPGGGKMILQSMFLLGEHYIDDFSQALLMPSKDGEDEERELYGLLIRTLGDDLTKVFINTIQEYIKARGAQGLTYFQLKVLSEIISTFKSRNVFVITAPAGSGKTEIFLFTMLYKLLLDLKHGVKRKIMIVYPRKFLEVDQSERLIKLIKILNDKLKATSFRHRKFSITIRDGDTVAIENEVISRASRDKRPVEVEFRGTKCGQNGTLKILVSVNPQDARIVCKESDGKYEDYPFVKWHRRHSKEADIIVTNLHTLFFRVNAMSNDDLDASDILGETPLDMIVFDEVHEYEPAELGLLYFILKVLNYARGEKNLSPLKVLLLSATIANAADLARELTDEYALILNYGDIVSRERSRIEMLEKSGRIGLTKKLVILGILTISPTYSWETYTSQLAVTLLYMNNALRMLNKGVKQTIIFLNNVRELNRVHSIIENDLQLGSPLDNACLRGSWGSILDHVKYRYSLCHYTYMLQNSQSGSIEISKFINDVSGYGHAKSYLFPRLAKVFSGTPLSERLKLVEEIRNEDVYVIIATSSLELGVDYPGVTVVANIGFSEKLPSLIQRFSRAGRRLSETLNTTLALLIVRNNPLEYTRLFEAIKTKALSFLVKGSLTFDVIEKLPKTSLSSISVEVARDLDVIKKLGLLRALLTLTALNGKYHGLKMLESEEEECKALINLHNYLKEYREVLAEMYRESDKLIDSILEHELGFKNILECKEHFSMLKQIDHCMGFIQNRANEVDEIIKILKDISEILHEVNSVNVCKELEDVIKHLGDHIIKKYNKILEELRQKVRFTDNDLKRVAEDVARLDHDLQQLCEGLREKLIKLIIEVLNNKEVLPKISPKISHVFKLVASINDKCDDVKSVKSGENPCKLVTSKVHM